MKKTLFLLTLVLASIGFGFGLKTYLVNSTAEGTELKRVTGIGGIFFKCKNPKQVREWYQTHLGITSNQYGAVFEWRQASDSSKKGFLQWSPFNEKSKYFEPSTKDFMINYRVADLVKLVNELKKEGVTITDTIETYDYGKFVHIMDIEGNKIELWEPNDIVFDNMGKTMGYQTIK